MSNGYRARIYPRDTGIWSSLRISVHCFDLLHCRQGGGCLQGCICVFVGVDVWVSSAERRLVQQGAGSRTNPSNPCSLHCTQYQVSKSEAAANGLGAVPPLNSAQQCRTYTCPREEA